MKVLKISIVAFVLITGMTGCKKSEIKPSNCTSNPTSTAVTNNDSESGMYYGREVVSDEENNDPGTTNIYGSGDDDRNGGDKTRKKTK